MLRNSIEYLQMSYSEIERMKNSLRLLLCIMSLGAFAQSPLTIPHATGYEVKSSINPMTYHLSVSLPNNYDTKKQYPVYYILDGFYAAEIAHGAHKSLKFSNEIEDIIVVTIAGNEQNNVKSWFANRWPDLTFTPNPSDDSSAAIAWKIPAPGLKSGGGERFLQVLTKEIFPFIEQRYSTNGHRGISGHSLGGLFAGNVLFHSPELFDRYGINSPSFLDWNKNDIFMAEKKLSETHKSLLAKVFLSFGGLEGSNNIENLRELERLMKAHYTGIETHYVVFDNETHASVASAMISRCMRYLYARKKK